MCYKYLNWEGLALKRYIDIVGVHGLDTDRDII